MFSIGPALSNALIATILTSALGYIFYKVYIYPTFLSPLRVVPGPPLGHPLLGQLRSLHGPKIGEIQQEWFKKYGPIVRVQAPLGVERLLIQDPETISLILKDYFFQANKAPYATRIVKLVTGHGLLTTDGEEHNQMRKMLNPAFSLSNLANQSDMYQEPIEGLVQVFASLVGNQEMGAIIPVYEWISKATLDILCRTMFGYECDTVNTPGDALVAAYEKLLGMQTGKTFVLITFLSSIPGAYNNFQFHP